MTYDSTGMLDPDTATRALCLGVRGVSLESNWYRGLMWRPRIWGDIALTEKDWLTIYELEKGWFA